MITNEQSYHLTMDSSVHLYQAYQPKIGWGPILANRLTTYNLNLSYRFSPHFHPYVPQLAKELSDTDSVFDLLAMNVLYQANSDGSLLGTPDSKRAGLSNL